MTTKQLMASYTQDELISATHAARHFGNILDKLSKKKQKKVGVLRKNKLEVVIIPAKEYENMAKFKSLIEDYFLYKEIDERMKTSKKKYVDFENILKENNITL